MARTAKAGEGNRAVTNVTEATETVRNAVPAIINLKDQRKAINAEIAEIRERVNAAGVPKKALDHAIKLKEMDPEDRERWDEGFAIARDAIAIPVSRSLFDMLDTPTGKPNGDAKPKGTQEALAAAREHLGSNDTTDETVAAE